MKYEVGQYVIGKVKSVKPYALFLSFEENITGLLHISEISDSFIRDIEKYGTIGDELKVKIVAVDQTNGFLRVSLKQVPKEEAYSSHKEIRLSPIASEEEFKALKEKIPEWMKETLEKIDNKEK